MAYTCVEYSISEIDRIYNYLQTISPTTFLTITPLKDRVMIAWL